MKPLEALGVVFLFILLVPIFFLLTTALVWACIEVVGGVNLDFREAAGIALLVTLCRASARSG